MRKTDESSEPQHQSQENMTKSTKAKVKFLFSDTPYLRKRYANDLGGLRALDTFTIENFIETKTNLSAFSAAKNFDPNKQNLFFQGSTGSGKSHLASIAARKYLSDGVSTVTQMDISRLVRSAEDARDEMDVLDCLVRRHVLVIEDLGVAKDTEFSISLLYEIINGRYMERPGGLIVTSNLGLGDLAAKLGDDRISSRLAQMCRVFNLSSEKDRRVA